MLQQHQHVRLIVRRLSTKQTCQQEAQQKNTECFEVVSVDLCGPWPIEAVVREFKTSKRGKIKSKKQEVIEKTVRLQIWALTMVDKALTWIQISNIKNKSSKHILP